MVDGVQRTTNASTLGKSGGGRLGNARPRAVLFALLLAIAAFAAVLAPCFPKCAFAQEEPSESASWYSAWYAEDYSADGTLVYAEVIFSSPVSLAEKDFSIKVRYESTDEVVEYAGDQVDVWEKYVDPVYAGKVSTMLDLKGVQEISYQVYCEGELVDSRSNYQIIAPLELGPALFEVDAESMTAKPKNPAGLEGDSSVAALAEGDVRYYWILGGERIDDPSLHDPKTPGTHQLWAAEGPSGNTEGETLLGEWTVPDPGAYGEGAEGESEAGHDGENAGTDGSGDDGDVEGSAGVTAPSVTPDAPAVPDAPTGPFGPSVSPDQPALPVSPDQSAPPVWESEEKTKFEDVPEGAWFEDAVYSVAEEGLMEPRSETLFGVRDVLTRAEAAQLAMELLGGSPEEGSSFPDVDEDCAFAGAIEWARSRGIMNGYAGTGLFGPEDPVTQEQLATILLNVRTWQGEVSCDDASGVLSSEEVESILARVQGGEAVSSWAREAVAWAVRNEWEGLLSFNPACPVTRGEAAAFIFGARA